MFEASCAQPSEDPSCGIFGSTTKEVTRLTLDEFLEKLDLMEYKDAFEAKGATDVASLARLTDADLETFHLRKLEKRKLLHHLAKARASDANDNLLCGST